MSCPSDLLDSFRWTPPEQSVTSKVCSSCHETVPMHNFSSCSAAKDGKQAYCKTCARSWWTRPKSAHAQHSELTSAASTSEEFLVTQELVPDALYIMENPRILGEIKIGRSRDPEERAKQLCAGNNYRMVVKRTYGEKGFLEKTTHKKLKRRRVEEGASVEWFRISVEQAEALIIAAIIEDDVSKS